MKLKKIASLMLAGVMAVSMLAGCKSGTGSDTTPGNDDTVVVPETGIAAAFNNGQSKNNDAEVKFTEDSNLDEIVAKVVKELGDSADDEAVLNRVMGYLGVENTQEFYVEGNSGLKDASKNGIVNHDADGNDKIAPVTRVYAYTVTSSSAWNEENAVKLAVNEADGRIADLDADSVIDPKKEGDSLNVGEKYYTFGYTGNVSMVSEKNADGTTDYYFVAIVTQTVTLVEYKV